MSAPFSQSISATALLQVSAEPASRLVRKTHHETPRPWTWPLARTPRRYFGLIDGLPPGVPGGGMTGMLSPEGGGVRFICGSTPGGGVTTPPDRPKSELLVPLAGGAIGGFV